MKSLVEAVCSFIAGTAMLLSLNAVHASADQSSRIPRIGVPFSPDTSSPMEEGLRQGFRDRGYSENVNISIDWRRSGETGNELKSLILDLARSGADLLVVFSTPAARTAHETTTIPVVALVGDPVGSGLAGNLARPDQNITGVSLLTTELTAKRLELLHQMVPNARRIIVLMNTSNRSSLLQVDETKRAASVLGMQIVPSDARNSAELAVMLRRLNRDSADAVLVTGDLFLMSNRAKIAQALRIARLPAIYPNRRYHDEGALMSYGPDVREAARRLASFVDRILKGAKPGDLPFEQVAQFELVIDTRIAREQRIEVPQELLLRADEVLR